MPNQLENLLREVQQSILMIDKRITKLDELPKGGDDPNLDKRIKSDLDDLRICIKLYENRLERE